MNYKHGMAVIQQAGWWPLSSRRQLTGMAASGLRHLAAALILGLVLTGCGGAADNVTRVTIVPTQIGAGAPVYTATATFTPSATPTATNTFTPTATFTPTHTATNTPTATVTPTSSDTPTPLPTATTALLTLTPVDTSAAPAAVEIAPAPLSAAEGWPCGDFPCEDDIEGFLQRIQVPPGFAISHVGRFPGQVMQIAYGPDGRLYATVLENGTRTGAVYAMDGAGTAERYSDTLISPVGLAFQPGTDVLYATARLAPASGGVLWRILSDHTQEQVLDDLPCCYQDIGPQPNGIVFGPDGLLYMGIGGITDHGEPQNPQVQSIADSHPYEAAILRVNPHTGEVIPFAQGIHNPYDMDFDSRGRWFAADSGIVTGQGDRILRILEGAHYGWPFYRLRGCAECPPTRGALEVMPDLLTLPDYTLPQGMVVYKGSSFPANMQDTLLVTLWNGTPWGQRVIWVDPENPLLGSDEYEPQAFVTGLIRPVDAAVAPDGTLVVADFVYGHIWRVAFTGENMASRAFVMPTASPGG